jgi:hypothetical protein
VGTILFDDMLLGAAPSCSSGAQSRPRPSSFRISVPSAAANSLWAKWHYAFPAILARKFGIRVVVR